MDPTIKQEISNAILSPNLIISKVERDCIFFYRKKCNIIARETVSSITASIIARETLSSYHFLPCLELPFVQPIEQILFKSDHIILYHAIRVDSLQDKTHGQPH